MSPLSLEPVVVRLACAGQPAVAEIGQRRIVQLNNIDARLSERSGFRGEQLREMFHVVIDGRIGLGAEVLVPLANRNQER